MARTKPAGVLKAAEDSSAFTDAAVIEIGWPFASVSLNRSAKCGISICAPLVLPFKLVMTLSSRTIGGRSATATVMFSVLDATSPSLSLRT